ncbi:hypothetical protein AXF42_Ash020747 [Apostasia shenzhenica]|uniref:KEN domain-containing protein n=1 Tax=Apostasia shenzhenica TaxID=1088818 RepID=A0A2I0APL7_9ASPA|nr:hypothetical protein AXF42_Ash020747 [Apostasia shenzhenica]
METRWSFDFESKTARDENKNIFKVKEKDYEVVQDEITFLCEYAPKVNFLLRVAIFEFHEGKGYILYDSSNKLLKDIVAEMFQLSDGGKYQFSIIGKKYIWCIIKFILYLHSINIPHRKISLKLKHIHVSSDDTVMLGELDEIFHDEVNDFIASSVQRVRSIICSREKTILHVHPALWDSMYVEDFIHRLNKFLSKSKLTNFQEKKIEEAFQAKGRYVKWPLRIDDVIIQARVHPNTSEQVDYVSNYKDFVRCVRNCFAHYKENLQVHALYQFLFINMGNSIINLFFFQIFVNGVESYFDVRWPAWLLDMWKISHILQKDDKILETYFVKC